jgi:hypothetical protein
MQKAGVFELQPAFAKASDGQAFYIQHSLFDISHSVFPFSFLILHS